LGTIAPPAEVRSLRQSEQQKQVRHARTCYDHLAGALGVKVTEALLKMEVIVLKDEEFIVTEQGKKWFFEFGINIEEANKKRRIFAKPCLDWSERRYHISGWLGSAIANRFFDQAWITRAKENRSVQLTQLGTKALKDQFDIEKI
jgi:predicted transcriptional regulator